ncbi:MAG TPA: hypothetical protein VFV52_09365 [Bacilli bacterium]|nr:hypothetical protein [Bacilli bacterium]
MIDKQVETNGATIRNIIEGCGVFQSRVTKLLAEKGIAEIKMDGWYPLQTVIDIIQELAKSVGPNILSEIGKTVPKNSQFPPEIDSFEKVLVALDFAYKANHRNGKIGSYEVAQLEPKKYKVTCDNPYPPNFNLGLLRGLSRKFSTLVRIEQTDNSVRGGEFVVKW